MLVDTIHNVGRSDWRVGQRDYIEGLSALKASQGFKQLGKKIVSVF
jgi:hypothetical protein